jgi:hypothetical protein
MKLYHLRSSSNYSLLFPAFTRSRPISVFRMKGQVSYKRKTRSNITVLFILIFRVYTGVGKTKNSERNCSKRFLFKICSYILRDSGAGAK